MSDVFDWRWFNYSSPHFRIGRTFIRPWNLFNRCSVDGHWWGAGLLQIGNRHLFFIGYCGIYLVFWGKTP